MIYACRSERAFVVKKDLIRKKKLSEEAKSIREYIQNHNFSIQIDPVTKEAKMSVTERENEE